MNFKEILEKIVTYNDIKSAPPSSDSTFWNICFGLRRGFFLDETSILVFAESAILLNFVRKITR